MAQYCEVQRVWGVWNVSDAGGEFILWATFMTHDMAQKWHGDLLATGMIGQYEFLIVEQGITTPVLTMEEAYNLGWK